MHRSLAFRTALARRVLVAAGVLGSVAVGCGDDSVAGGGGSGGNNAGGDNQGGNNSGGDNAGGQNTGGDASGGAPEGGAGHGGAVQGGAGQGGEGGGVQEGVQRCFAAGIEGCLPIEEAEINYPCTNDLELVLDWISGPTEVGKECCYQVEVSAPGDPGCAVIGRPLLVDDVPQRALVSAARSSGAGAGARAWGVATTAQPDVSGLSASARAELARAWADDAAYEHASIASFSKFSLELISFGAPAHLVAAAHEAAIDEIRHASLGFALASAYAGQPLAPGRLEAAANITCARDLESLVASVVREGCVGETLAALVAGAQSAVAADSAVRQALLSIAEDETRHAELAWRTVVWAVEIGGDRVKAAARAAFDIAIAAVEAATPASERAHHAHGRLSGAEAQEERLRGLRDVVRPAANALLGERP